MAMVVAWEEWVWVAWGWAWEGMVDPLTVVQGHLEVPRGHSEGRHLPLPAEPGLGGLAVGEDS